jgi:predicted nucleotidyltransferase
MKKSEDFKEFIKFLNDHECRYLIVGGYALSFHSQPKLTVDIDFWIDPKPDNAEKIIKVLTDFGFGKLNITVDDLTDLNNVIQLGKTPLRIDLLTSIDGLIFEKAYKNRVIGKYIDIKANFISLEDLILNKKSSGRKKDLYDLNWIEQYSGK